MMEPLLETWDRSLAKVAFSICHARARFIRRLAPPAAEIYMDICKRADQPFSLSYQPSIPAPQGADWADVSPAEGEAHIRAALAAARSEDYKTTAPPWAPTGITWR